MQTLPDELERINWEGELRDGHQSEEVLLGTTDECVVFQSETGRRGSVPREHISAVESQVRTETEFEGNDYRLFTGGGAVLSTVAFVGAIQATSGFVALVLVLLAVAGLRLADHGWKHREEYDGVRRVEREVEHVTVHADCGVRRRFVVPVESRAGARLSEFVRESAQRRHALISGDGPRESSDSGALASSDPEARASND